MCRRSVPPAAAQPELVSVVSHCTMTHRAHVRRGDTELEEKDAMEHSRTTDSSHGSFPLQEDDHAMPSPTKFGLAFILNNRDHTEAYATPAPPYHATDHTAPAAGDVQTPAAPGSKASNATASPLTLDKKRGRMCKADGCTNYIVYKGLCCRHGGGKKCSVQGCETSAKLGGRCWKHGGSVACKVDDCTKKAKAKGLCWAHGGGVKCRAVDTCTKVAVSSGLCWAHGGGKRCIFDGCNRPAYERTHSFCIRHYNELQDVDYYEV